MKLRLLLVLFGTAALFVLMPSGAHSQERGATSDETFRKQVEAAYKNHDRNGDGYLDKDEMPQEIRFMLIKNDPTVDERTLFITFPRFLQFHEEMFRKMIEVSFKNRDKDHDGYLDQQEMPEDLRAHVARYSRGGDGRISPNEYLEFRRDRAFPPAVHPGPPAAKRVVMAPPPLIIDQSDLEKRPTMHRAGNLPKGMPAWFEKFDADEDGQIALFEWRKAGKPIGEFVAWDRNDDGLITIEEVLYKLEQDRLVAQREGKPITVGSGKEFRESMEDGGATAYLVKLEKGKTYRIDMVAENTQMLDPYLYLMDHQGKLLAKDDDSGGQLNARIQFTPKATGNFRILAASVGNRGNGEYFLIIQDKTERPPIAATREAPQ